MKPGIHVVSNKIYHSGIGLSSSGIKALLKSSAHYLEYKTNPPLETPAMATGSLVHSLILEPEKFDEQYVVGDYGNRSSGDYKKLVRDNPDKIVINASQFEEAELISSAFFKEQSENEKLKALTEIGHKELSFYWEDKATGILCKARPDIIPHDGSVIVDIKTASDASFDAFQKSVIDYKYFISAPFYLRGVREVLSLAPGFLPQAPTRFVFIVIETKAPYPVAIYELDLNALEFGEKLIDRALDTYAESVATDIWSGYSKEIIPMPLPNWAFYKSNYMGGAK